MTAMGNARWARVGPLLFITYLVAYVDRLNISMAMPDLTRELGINASAGGVLLSSFFWGYVITQIPGGYLANRFNAKKVIVWAMVLWGILAGLTGVVNTFNGLIVVRFLLGLVEGVVFPSLLVMSSKWYPDKERSKAVGLFETALPASSLILSPVAGWMIAATNWHMMFILQAIPPFIMAVLVGMFVGHTPQTDKYLSKQEREYIETSISAEAAQNSSSTSFLKALFNKRILLLGVIYLMWDMGLYTFGLWLPSLVKQLAHVGIGTVGLLAAIPYLFAVVGLNVNSAWADKRRKRRLHVTGPLFLAGLSLIASHFAGVNLALNIVFITLAGIGVYSAFGPWWAWAMEGVQRNYVGPAMGAINLIGNLGGITGPTLIGDIEQRTGSFSTGFYVLGFILLVGGLLTFAVKNRVHVNSRRDMEASSA